MFFVLSKLLYFLIDPLNWIIAGLIYGLIHSSNRKGRLAMILSVSGLILFTNPLLSNLAYRKWELPPIKKEELPLCDAAVVLTGMVHEGYSPTDQVHFSGAADRITEAIRLKKAGLIQELVISGGSGELFYSDSQSESRKLETLLNASGISRNYHLEERSRNTYENAFYTAQLLDSIRLRDRRVLLITSAFHMPRAIKCFNKQGVEVIPYPVDYRSRTVDLSLDWIIPTADALSSWRTLIKEWVGVVAYRLVGYA